MAVSSTVHYVVSVAVRLPIAEVGSMAGTAVVLAYCGCKLDCWCLFHRLSLTVSAAVTLPIAAVRLVVSAAVTLPIAAVRLVVSAAVTPAYCSSKTSCQCCCNPAYCSSKTSRQCCCTSPAHRRASHLAGCNI
jgi:hypothetical protein